MENDKIEDSGAVEKVYTGRAATFSRREWGLYFRTLNVIARFVNGMKRRLRACFKSAFWFSEGPIGDSSSLS